MKSKLGKLSTSMLNQAILAIVLLVVLFKLYDVKSGYMLNSYLKLNIYELISRKRVVCR
jgi:hypothetical protein